MEASIPVRVVVVDDNRDAADSLAELLVCLGYEVAAAYDGQEAIRLSSTFRPDAMLIDLAMPHMDGPELAQKIRHQAGIRYILLVAVTGLSGDEHRRRAAEAGFDHYLVKPVDLDHLNGLLSALCRAAEDVSARRTDTCPSS